jgi:hypothetical protein
MRFAMPALHEPVKALSLPRVEESAVRFDHHVISDEAFEELLEYLKEDSGYEYAQAACI